jgi:hypothetical protein
MSEMQSIREIVRDIIGDMETIKRECDPVPCNHFRRLAVLTYSDFLRHAPERSQEINQQCLAEVLVYVERALSLGASNEKIEESFERLRKFWIPRLGKEKTHA